MEEKIIKIIAENFPNGVRDDFIDTNKILKIYRAKFPEENISAEKITNAIHAQGTENHGRFYFVSAESVKHLLFVVKEIFESYSAAYYSELYRRHDDFFSRLNIFSAEVLKKILIANSQEFFCFDEFCTLSRGFKLDYEVAKIFYTENKSLSLDELQKMFRYVPAEKILSVITNTKKYLPTIEDKYFPISKIKFDAEEISIAEQEINSAIAEKNFAAREDYDLSSNFALNPEIDVKILRDLIYQKFFADKFDRNRTRLVKKTASIKKRLGFGKLIHELCSSKDELTFDDVSYFSSKYLPSSHGYAVTLAFFNENMTRVSEDLFVKDSLINFDVAAVDDALENFVQKKIIPIRAVNDFTNFPPIENYSWNLYLLESFLRKYSEKFIFTSAHFNNSNIGAIYPASMNFADYLDVQVAAVIQEKILLKPEEVGNFLVGEGYRGQRSVKIIQRVIQQAKKILNLE